MQGTLKMFRTINDNKLNNYTLEELSITYQSNRSPQIIANAFIRLYDLINNCGNKFFYISSEDLSSMSVQCVNECLLNYTKDNASFSSYFYTVLYKTLLTEYNRRKYDKYILNYDNRLIVSDISIYEWDHNEEKRYRQSDLSGNNIKSDIEEDILTEMLIDDSEELNDKEKLLCHYIIHGYDKCSKVEISELMNVSRPTVYSLIKSLQTKLQIIFSN